jgi:hypothetical protein
MTIQDILDAVGWGAHKRSVVYWRIKKAGIKTEKIVVKGTRGRMVSFDPAAGAALIATLRAETKDEPKAKKIEPRREFEIAVRHLLRLMERDGVESITLQAGRADIERTIDEVIK